AVDHGLAPELLGEHLAVLREGEPGLRERPGERDVTAEGAPLIGDLPLDGVTDLLVRDFDERIPRRRLDEEQLVDPGLERALVELAQLAGVIRKRATARRGDA